MPRRLSRELDGRPAAPVRIIHLGLGNFFRAHTAVYTAHAADADAWGIAAFTGRSYALAETLGEQDGLYTLVVQHPDANAYDVIESISATLPGPDVDALVELFASPDVVIVTSTVTEAAYLLDDAGHLDVLHEAIQGDAAALRDGRLTDVTTVPGRFVAGLIRRRLAGAGPLSFVPCDNVPENGAMVETVVRELGRLVDPALDAWIDGHIGFVTTMVDRITPSVTPDVVSVVTADTSMADPAPVATEPFSEWVLSGEFLGGRPAWETAGATFVDDIAPHEMRKLWLLNGSHSLMAYVGTVVGKDTVYDAITDSEIAGWVNDWWDIAARHLPLPEGEIAAYRGALVERFSNPRMEDALARIAADGSVKLPIRVVPALLADRAAGNTPIGAERAIAAWILHLRGMGAPVNDARADQVLPLVEGTLKASVAGICDYLQIADPASRASILMLAEDLAVHAGT